eukprot:gb/GECH01005662.1/.p1 GENE.gb/GECH01005662.1/~~gb/GECH01005662.1/.p1  ORF type:complete len:736 (+),score=149.34 gb/GECH01005662.1/:1-2208(+)
MEPKHDKNQLEESFYDQDEVRDNPYFKEPNLEIPKSFKIIKAKDINKLMENNLLIEHYVNEKDKRLFQWLGSIDGIEKCEFKLNMNKPIPKREFNFSALARLWENENVNENILHSVLSVNFYLIDFLYGNYQALKDLERLAGLGIQHAYHVLGIIHADGLNVTADPNKAIQIFRQAANFGPSACCLYLIDADGNPYLWSGDIGQEKAILLRSMELAARENIAMCNYHLYKIQGSPLLRLEKAARADGMMEAKYDYAEAIEAGSPEAERLFEESAELNYPKAHSKLAIIVTNEDDKKHHEKQYGHLSEHYNDFINEYPILANNQLETNPKKLPFLHPIIIASLGRIIKKNLSPDKLCHVYQKLFLLQVINNYAPQFWEKVNDEGSKTLSSITLRKEHYFKIVRTTLLKVSSFNINDFAQATQIYPFVGIIDISEEECQPDVVECIERAASKWGNPEGEYHYALLLEQGWGVPRDIDRALSYYKSAAAQKHSEALAIWERKEGMREAEKNYQNGLKYKEGKEGFEQDENEAFRCFKQAAQHGHGISQLNVAIDYYYGIGVEKNIHKAFEWFEKTPLNNSDVQTQLGVDLIKQNEYSKAFKMLKTAASKGNTSAQRNLGFLYFYGFGVDKKNYSESRRLWEQASKKSDTRAKANLGLMYQNGFGVEKDLNQALTLYEDAVEKEDCFALYNLGFLYYEGMGVSRDESKARELISRACDNGHPFAAQIQQMKEEKKLFFC